MANMIIRSIRTVVHDHHHNAFTGARWFQGNLYVAHRQGDSHVCQRGRVIVHQSRDQGMTFDPVSVLRGQFDTRDSHLYHRDDKRLFLAAWEGTDDKPLKAISGCAYTDDGDRWSPWTRYTGTDGWVMWRPEYFNGRHYCIGYDFATPGYGKIGWFESDNGINWEFKHIVHEGIDQPNEVFVEFQADGSVIALSRREHATKSPILMKSKAPYTTWEKTELDVAIAGPCLWTVGGEVFISGRWFPDVKTQLIAHTAVFKVIGNRVELEVVLPSGPKFDHSYMGVAQWPGDPKRFSFSYYSNHQSHANPAISQWSHPGVYIIDAEFGENTGQPW